MAHSWTRTLAATAAPPTASRSKTDAGPLPLTDASTSGEARHLRIRDAINAKLDKSLDIATRNETEILDLAVAGKTIEAVSLARKHYRFNLTQAKEFVDGLKR